MNGEHPEALPRGTQVSHRRHEATQFVWDPPVERSGKLAAFTLFAFQQKVEVHITKMLDALLHPGWTTNTCNEATKTDRQKQTNLQNSMNEEARRQRRSSDENLE